MKFSFNSEDSYAGFMMCIYIRIHRMHAVEKKGCFTLKEKHERLDHSDGHRRPTGNSFASVLLRDCSRRVYEIYRWMALLFLTEHWLKMSESGCEPWQSSSVSPSRCHHLVQRPIWLRGGRRLVLNEEAWEEDSENEVAVVKISLISCRYWFVVVVVAAQIFDCTSINV